MTAVKPLLRNHSPALKHKMLPNKPLLRLKIIYLLYARLHCPYDINLHVPIYN